MKSTAAGKARRKKGREKLKFPTSNHKYMREIFPILKLVAHSNPETRTALLSSLDRNAFHTVCECVQNVVQNPDIVTSPEQRQYLKDHVGVGKKKIRQFLNSKMSLKSRRRKGVQIGGFLGTIMSVAIPILADLLFSKLSK